MRTLVAVYDALEGAEHALDEILGGRVQAEAIDLVAGVDPDRLRPWFDDEGRLRSDVGGPEDAVLVDVLVGLDGLTTELRLFQLAGVGPVLAAGPHAATLRVRGTGGVAGLVSMLVGLGVPSRDAGAFVEIIRRGSALVAVTVPEADVDTAKFMLRREQPVDVASRLAESSFA